MDIRPLKVTVREVVAGYVDDSDREEGIRGYSIPGLFGNPHARTFSQLLPKEKERILDYELLVYVCEGADTDDEVKDKTVLCNCDDPYESNFFYYFASRFNDIGLKKLVATCYDGSPVAYTVDGKPRSPYSRIIIRRKR